MPKWFHVADPWTPSRLSDMVLWLDADDGSTLYDATSGGNLVTSHDGQVKRWQDKSGNARHATQSSANGPKIQTTSGTLNSKKVLKFVEDTNSFLTIADSSAFRTYPLSVAVVMRTSQTAANNGVVGKWGGAGAREWVLMHNSAVNARPMATLRNSADNANLFVEHSGTMYNGAGRILSAAFDPPSGNIELFLDAVSRGTASATSSNGTSTSSLAIGSYAATDNTVGLTGDIAEVVMWSNVTAGDREKVEGYLAHKWGLSADLPSNHPYRNSAP